MAESFWLTCALCRHLTIHPCVLSSEPLSWSVIGPSRAPNDEPEKNSEIRSFEEFTLHKELI